MVCKQQKSWHTTAYSRDLVISVSCNELKQNNRLFKTNHRTKWPPKKAVIAFVFFHHFCFVYFVLCVGFIRVELDMNEQKNRINALENVAEANH